MAGNNINWNQIQGVASPNASLIGTAGDLFNNAVAIADKSLGKSQADETANLEAERGANTEDFISRLSGATTPEELSAIQASAKGEFVDRKALNDAARTDLTNINALASKKSIADNKIMATSLENRLKANDKTTLQEDKQTEARNAIALAKQATQIGKYKGEYNNATIPEQQTMINKKMTNWDTQEIFNEDSGLFGGYLAGNNLRVYMGDKLNSGVRKSIGMGADGVEQFISAPVSPTILDNALQYGKDSSNFFTDPDVTKLLVDKYVETNAMKAQMENLQRGAKLLLGSNDPQEKAEGVAKQQEYLNIAKAQNISAKELKALEGKASLKAEAAKKNKPSKENTSGRAGERTNKISEYFFGK